MEVIDVANYIDTQCNGNLQIAIEYIKNIYKCNIECKNNVHQYGFVNYIIYYNGIELNIPFNKKRVVEFILKLWTILLKEEKNKIIESCQKSQNYNMAQIQAQSQGQSQVSNNSNNNIINIDMKNIIDISTLSQLSNQVTQSTTIENKQEIQNLINELEKAKDDIDSESYFSLLLKLLEKLESTGLVPKWLGSAAKFARKAFDK